MVLASVFAVFFDLASSVAVGVAREPERISISSALSVLPAGTPRRKVEVGVNCSLRAEARFPMRAGSAGLRWPQSNSPRTGEAL